MVRIHKAVCRAFHGPAPTARHEVAHNDGDRRNNGEDNLRWATRKENAIDATIHGNVRSAVFTVAKAREARLLLDEAIDDIADRFGVSRSTVVKLLLRKTWGWM